MADAAVGTQAWRSELEAEALALIQGDDFATGTFSKVEAVTLVGILTYGYGIVVRWDAQTQTFSWGRDDDYTARLSFTAGKVCVITATRGQGLHSIRAETLIEAVGKWLVR